MSATIADIRERLKMEEIPDPQIEVHLKRAQRDFRGKTFAGDDDGFDEVEAVACKAIYYLAHLLWLRIQQRVNEYDETLTTFSDVAQFQEYWLSRSESIPVTDDLSGEVTIGGLRWAAV